MTREEEASSQEGRNRLINLIATIGLVKVELCKRTGMPRGTFMNKADPKQSSYRFNAEELLQIQLALRDIAEEIYTYLPDDVKPRRLVK